MRSALCFPACHLSEAPQGLGFLQVASPGDEIDHITPFACAVIHPLATLVIDGKGRAAILAERRAAVGFGHPWKPQALPSLRDGKSILAVLEIGVGTHDAPTFPRPLAGHPLPTLEALIFQGRSQVDGQSLQQLLELEGDSLGRDA